MGVGSSSPPAPQIQEDLVPPTAPGTTAVEMSYPLDIASAQQYLERKVPLAVSMGGVIGLARGYYVGDLAAFYGYTTALGMGMGCTAFYGTAYLLRHARQKDDIQNFVLSGGITGLWVAAGVTRSLPRGVVGAVVGAAVGTGIKMGGDWLYDSSREAWVAHRVHRLEHSKPRVLETRKPMFHPKDSQLLRKPSQAQMRAPDNLAPPTVQPTSTPTPETKKKGWLW